MRRAAEDALADAGVWADDCLVAAVYAESIWHGYSGARITLEPLERTNQ